MRIKGMRIDDIADELEMSPGGAYSAIDRGLESLRKQNDDRAKQLRDIQYLRLEELLEAWWPKAINGDGKALDRVIKLLEREAKLVGMDGASRFEISGPDGGAIEVDDPKAQQTRDARFVLLIDGWRARDDSGDSGGEAEDLESSQRPPVPSIPEPSV